MLPPEVSRSPPGAPVKRTEIDPPLGKYAVLGNHEYFGGYSGANYFDLFALPECGTTDEECGGSHPQYPEVYYQFQYNNTLFIALSTETDYSASSSQTTWLTNTLGAANDDPSIRFKVAYFHRPPYGNGERHQSEIAVRNAWHGLLSSYGVDLVFNGHNHNYEHSLVDGVHYLVIGGAGAALDGYSCSGASCPSWSLTRAEMFHAVVVDVDADQLTLTTYERDGGEVDGFSLAAGG